MMLAARFSSLRWRLTLLILALLAVTGSAFAWTAYREMERALRLQGSARIRAAAGQLADLLGQAGTNRVAEARRLTADASIRRFAAGDDAPGGALAALRAFIERNPTAAISLNAGGAGDAVHILEKNITIVRTATPAASVAAGDELGPLRVENGHLTYSVRVGVPAPQEGAAPLPATLTIDRPLASSAAAIALIKQLLGNDAAIKVGNVAGDVWTDLSVPVAAPPVSSADTSVSFVDAKGGNRLGQAVHIPGTPWRVWVEFSEAALLEPARTFLVRMFPITLVLIALGATAVRAVSGRMARPIERVADAADAVAAGKFSERVELRRNDEIGRLVAAFNVMSARVAESHEALEARVAQRTRELEEARDELDRFFSMSLDLLCIADVEGRFKRVNPAWEQSLGWTVGELTSGPYLQLVHPEDTERTAEEAARLAGGGTTVSFENRYRCKDGSYRWLSWKAVASEDRGLVYAAARDVTDQRRAARELQQHAARLAAMNRELEAFSYSVSHDLRAPLRSIDGFSLALMEDCAERLGAEGEDHLKRIRAAAQHMGRLIDDLLKLARVTRADMQWGLIDLSAMAQSTLDTLAGADSARKVERCVQPGVQGFGDVHLMQIAVTNLLDNAWKFTGKREDARIEFGALKNGRGTVYFVRDNGAGFDMAYAGKLFGTFQRLHHANDYPGTGIGLATVQRILLRHGGRIWAESTVGQGATFFFTLQPEAAP